MAQDPEFHKIKRLPPYVFAEVNALKAEARAGGEDVVDIIRAHYRSRRDVLVEGLRSAGWEIPSPEATMFCWAPIPEAWREAQVAVAPGIGFGEFGEGFVRFGLVENEQRIRQAVRNIRRFLNSPTHKKSGKAARVE